MIQIDDINKRYEQGSTDFHTAVLPRSASDGGSGGARRDVNASSPHKPAALATLLPNPSQGKLGTAISAIFHYLGTASTRFWRRKGGPVLFGKLLAFTTLFMFRHLRLAVREITICRAGLDETTIPRGTIYRFAHDRKHAIFRRRAVLSKLNHTVHSPCCRTGGHPTWAGCRCSRMLQRPVGES